MNECLSRVLTIVITVPAFCSLVSGGCFLTCHHGNGGGGGYHSAVGRQPSKVSKRCQHLACHMLAQCACDLGIYTTVDCDTITRRPPLIVSRQQRVPVFDADIGL